MKLTELVWNRHGISVPQLAKALNMSERSVHRIGRDTKLTVALAIDISEYIEAQTGQKLMPWEYSEEYQGLRDLIN